MKKKSYIAFVAFAVAVMLTAAFMPHHHHNGALCTEVEYCEDDECYNDQHTAHGNSDSKDHCIDNADFITAKRLYCIDDAGTSLLPVFILAERFVLCLSNQEDTPYGSIYRLSLYKSAELHPYNIRRGPPSLLV